MTEQFDNAVIELKKLSDNHDTEIAHIKADAILLELLSLLLTTSAYANIEEAYRSIDKWYA